MLVLSMKEKDDPIIIRAHGEVIEIALVEIRGDKARIGISADKSVEINRLVVDQAKHPKDYLT